GPSDLQLQVWQGDAFRPITGNSMAQTQARIEALISMDYDTFINSAFLLQGRADEFTTKPPERRKEVLASIMGLGLYDRLEARARQRATERERDQRDAEARLATLQEEIDHRGEHESALKEAQAQLAQAMELLDAATREADALRRRADDLRRRQTEAEELRRAIATRETDIAHLRRQLQAHQSRVQEYEALLAQRDEVVARHGELLTQRERLEALDSALSQRSALQQQRTPLLATIHGAEATLREQARAQEARIANELQPKAERFPSLEQALAQARERADSLVAQQEAIVAGRARLQELANRSGELRSALERLKQEGLDLKAKLDIIERSPQEARCPLCNSLLGDQEYQHLRESHHSQIETRRAAYRETEQTFKALESRRVGMERETKERESALRRAQADAQSQVTSLEHQFRDSRDAAQELGVARDALSRLAGRLQVSDFAQTERVRLAELDALLAKLPYDAAEHERVRRAVQELRPYEERHRRLQDAESGLPQEREGLSRVQQMLARAAQEQESARAKLSEAQAALAELPSVEVSLREADARHAGLDSRQRALLAREGELAGRLKRVQEAEQESHAVRRKLQEAAEEVSLYRELAQAFGGRGVQAMLIESVLPDLEREANELLARMTQNRMHVKLETQREARSRKGAEPIETLEIKIADELGTRSYELYSGGEAFRINLALRIALSRILAERS
ncbi:MAG: SMC family ATPase, partial [Chloroflexota bacterium]|nr:SMC family ATPase [Chloroflexota bacterium]